MTINLESKEFSKTFKINSLSKKQYACVNFKIFENKVWRLEKVKVDVHNGDVDVSEFTVNDWVFIGELSKKVLEISEKLNKELKQNLKEAKCAGK